MSADEPLHPALQRYIDQGDEWRAGMDAWRGEVIAKLDRNTEVCEDIERAYIAGRIATKIVKWVGAIALALASVSWAWSELLGQHRPPGGGIGPQ